LALAPDLSGVIVFTVIAIAAAGACVDWNRAGTVCSTSSVTSADALHVVLAHLGAGRPGSQALKVLDLRLGCPYPIREVHRFFPNTLSTVGPTFCSGGAW
jgi:hypothetical protein